MTKVALKVGQKRYDRVMSNGRSLNAHSLQAAIIIHNYTIRTQPIFHYMAISFRKADV